MKITVLCVGKTREGFVQEGIEKYLRYLKPYCDISLREVKEEKFHDLREASQVRKQEAERIRKATAPGSFIIALDERGQEFTSHQFAEFMNRLFESGTKDVVAVLGGSLGLDESVTGRADKVIALSRWTLTHEMARLVLLEQLYRALTIIKGKPYHH